jgi:hypothetical protein
VDDVIMIGALVGTLVFAVAVVYCCLIVGARQDEISQKDYEEYCKMVNGEEDSL